MRQHFKTILMGVTFGMFVASNPYLRAGCESGCGESIQWAYKNPSLKCLVWSDIQADEGKVDTDLGTFTVFGNKDLALAYCPYLDCTQACPSAFDVPHEANASNGVHQGCSTSSNTFGNALCTAP